MKLVLSMSLFLTLFSYSLSAQTKEASNSETYDGISNSNSGWNSSYIGEISGTKSTLVLSSENSDLEGTIDAGGYIYSLEGKIEGINSKGILRDDNTGSVIEYTAALKDEVIEMSLNILNEFGQYSELQIDFRMKPLDSLNNPNSVSSIPNTRESHDPYLIGGWRHTETYTSGEFGTVSEWYMSIMQDGSYTYGDGQIAGSGDGTTFMSGGNSGHSSGRWKTENGIIFIDEGNGFQKYAEYYIEGNDMIFTFDDESNQLWERYR